MIIVRDPSRTTKDDVPQGINISQAVAVHEVSSGMLFCFMGLGEEGPFVIVKDWTWENLQWLGPPVSNVAITVVEAEWEFASPDALEDVTLMKVEDAEL